MGEDEPTLELSMLNKNVYDELVKYYDIKTWDDLPDCITGEESFDFDNIIGHNDIIEKLTTSIPTLESNPFDNIWITDPFSVIKAAHREHFASFNFKKFTDLSSPHHEYYNIMVVSEDDFPIRFLGVPENSAVNIESNSSDSKYAWNSEETYRVEKTYYSLRLSGEQVDDIDIYSKYDMGYYNELGFSIFTNLSDVDFQIYTDYEYDPEWEE